MGFRINTNVSALNAHNQGVLNNRNMSNSLERLSSGLRINKAADDASGLAIANSLRSQANSLGQAISNGNDAIGLIQTADGALDEYSKILDTIKTKSIQAASDGQNTNSRLAIQKDIDRLMEELNIIAKTTSFNGQKLLSGTYTNKEVQMGANSNESVKMSIASAETTKVGHTARSQLDVTGTGSVQLTMKSNLTGEQIKMQSVDIQYNNDAKNGMGALADVINSNSGITGIRAEAVVQSESASAIQAGSTGSDFAINGVNIGAIVVEDNDNSGSLLAAINGKTTETGVSATKSEDGKLILSSTDGRAIEVQGTVAEVTGSSAGSLSTLGHIELVQNGASDFEVTGIGAGAVGGSMSIGTTSTTIKDSILAGTSIIESGSHLAAGTVLGANVASENTASFSTDTRLTAGTQLTSGSVLKQDTEIGGALKTRAAATSNQDMTIAAGSILATGTRIGVGTVLGQDITIGSTTYAKGSTVTTALTTDNFVSLQSDTVFKYDSTTANNTSIAAGSTLAIGTTLGMDLTSTGTFTVAEEMIAQGGSSAASSSIIAVGSELGGTLVVSSDTTTTAQTKLAAGSILVSASSLAKGSTIGFNVTTNGATNIDEDMTVKAGSTLKSGTVLAAGTVLNQDTTQNGIDYKAGDVLQSDVTTNADITLTEDMTLLRGTNSTVPTIATASTLLLNTENSGTVGLGETSFSTLADIDVTTLDGAMKAIDTLASAISSLDTIRSDLGSVQNQLTSTINNISVTQVNVQAAESNIRDVDFAAESANFSRFNILSQAGSYAMSQANATQQNVLRLLQ